ncbi:MAG: hypothetical protein AAF632_05520 [Bacteroidota bacterium]
MTYTVGVKPIRSEKDYDEAIERIDRLLDVNPRLGTPEEDELEILSTLIEAYENKHYPILPLGPVMLYG